MKELWFLILSWAGCIAAMSVVVWFLRKRRYPVVSGIVIGFIAVACDVVCLLYYDKPWISSFRAIPLLTAGLFGAPLTALVAGVFSAVGVAAEYFFVLERPGMTNWLLIVGGVETLSTLLVAGYAIAVRRYVLDDRPPNFIQAGVLAGFGEFVHVGTTFLITGVFIRMGGTPAAGGTELTTQGLEFLYSFYPDTLIGAGVILSMVCLLAGGGKTWKKELFSPFSLCVLLFGGITFFVVEYSEHLAAQSARQMLATTRERLIVQLEDQIGYMLHRNAVLLREEMGASRRFSLREMQKYAEIFNVDEINVFAQNREILASNLESEMEYNQNGVPAGELRDFFELCNSSREFVKNPFRPSRSNPELYAKYIGVPFPDRSAFLQMGYWHEHLLEEFPTYFFPMFDTARIGQSGYFIVTDLEGKIVAPVANHPGKVGESIFQNGLKKAEWQEPQDTLFKANLFGSWCSVSWHGDLEQYRVFAVIPDAEYYTPALRLAIMILFLLFAIAFTFRVLMLRNARTQAKLDAVRKGDMELAASIQASELNKTPLDTPRCFVTAKMTPAREVGGDFYDYSQLEDNRVAFVIADVSGKGVPAAFVMMKARSLFHLSMYVSNSLQEAVCSANRQLCIGNDVCMFVTAWLGLFDPATGNCEYVSAGHNPPLVKRADGSVEWVKAKQRFKPLGLFANAEYQVSTLHLAPGDTLYLYTDGVTEAMTQKGVLYGEKRLEAVLKDAGADLIAAVTEDLDCFTGKALQADDITMLTLEVKDEPNC